MVERDRGDQLEQRRWSCSSLMGALPVPAVRGQSLGSVMSGQGKRRARLEMGMVGKAAKRKCWQSSCSCPTMTLRHGRRVGVSWLHLRVEQSAPY